jgi:hypothetical protein
VSGGAAEIYFPPGVYIVKQSIQITSGRIHLRGAGPMASVIHCGPPSGGALTAVTIFEFLNATLAPADAATVSGYSSQNRLPNASVRGLGFTSDSYTATTKKIAIALLNTDQCVVEDVSVGPGWTTTGDSYTSVSVGIQVVGGQLNKISRVGITADRPISIDRAPEGSYINCDHLHLSDLTLKPRSDQANLDIDQNVFVTNLQVDGLNSFNGGRWGVRWTAECPTAMRHTGVTLSNIRVEGMNKGGSGYPTNYPDTGSAIFIQSTTAYVENLRIVNVRGPGSSYDCAGLRANNAQGVVESCVFNSSDRPLDLAACSLECFANQFNVAGTLVGAMAVSRARGTILMVAPSPAAVAPYWGEKFNLAAQMPTGFYKRARISVVANESSGTAQSEAGEWLVTQHGLTQISATANVASGSATPSSSGKLYLQWASSGATFALWNQLSSDVDFTMVIEHST